MSANSLTPLVGKRIAVVVEDKFIPEEINAYRYGFGVLGAQVDFVSRLWGNKSKTFVSDVDPLEQPPFTTPESVTATVEISDLDLDSYSALLMSANYTSVRLRYAALPGVEQFPQPFNILAHIQSAPAVEKFAQAMLRKDLVKGFLCHGLWILTPNKHLLQGRTVVCNEVVAADVYNCGASIDMSRRVIVDDDVVTGYSKHEVIAYIRAIAQAII